MKSTVKRSAFERPLLALGLLGMIFSLVVMCWQDAASLLVIALFMAGMFVTTGVIYVYSSSRSGEDERIRKAIAFACLNSWLFLMWGLGGLVLGVAIIGPLGMSPLRLVTMVLLMMLVVFAGWYIFYILKGDVE